MNDGSFSTIERALQLARAGSCHSLDDIRRTLHGEGYTGISENLAGSSIQAQLKAAMAVAKAQAVRDE